MLVIHIMPHIFGSAPIEEIGEKGGGARFVFELGKTMAKRVDTKLIIFGKKRRSINLGGLLVEIYPAVSYLRFLNGDSNPISLRFLHEIDRADIVHLHQLRADLTLLSAIYSKLKGKKIFVTDHGWNGACVGRLKLVEHLVDGFLPDTNFDGKFLRKYKKPIVPIYGGVDIHKFQPALADNRKNNRVLFVGRIMPHKGINYLIEAIDDKVELHVVGRPVNKKYFEHLKSLSWGRNVKFICNASDKEVIREYQEAAISVLPSVYKDIYGKFYPKPELFGLVLIEAMACGTPVICTNVGGMPEVVEDGVTGFVVAPNDPVALKEKIYYLVNNPSVAKKMGEFARQRVLDNFTWDKVVKRCLKGYKNEGL